MYSIVQVYPDKNYKVYLYFSNGEIRLYDASDIVGKGVFSVLNDPDFFTGRCTVLNHTLAWDITGTYDPKECIDLDPDVLHERSVPVTDPLAWFA